MSKAGVEIPLDYLISTHVLLSRTYEKMKEVLGESAATMFFSMASDHQPLSALGGEDVELVRGKISSLMESFGYTLQQKKRGSQIEYRLTCPHAHTIHPHLGKDATFCPMAQMVVGAVRKEHKRSIIRKSELHLDGSSFTIEVQDSPTK